MAEDTCESVIRRDATNLAFEQSYPQEVARIEWFAQGSDGPALGTCAGLIPSANVAKRRLDAMHCEAVRTASLKPTTLRHPKHAMYAMHANDHERTTPLNNRYL